MHETEGPALPVSTPITAEFLHGALEVLPTQHGLQLQRLPRRARQQIHDADLASVVGAPAGVRVVMQTPSTEVQLVVLPLNLTARHDPVRWTPLYDLYVDGELAGQVPATRHARAGRPGSDVFEVTAPAETDRDTGEWLVELPELPGREKTLEIWLPYEEATEVREIRSDAEVRPVIADRPRWIHHGSSISQGYDAVGASHAWPAVASRSAERHLLNLAFAGHAMCDQFVARTLRDLPAELICLELGINVVNGDSMRLRTFSPAVHGFLDTIRDGHPETRLVLVSPIWCGIHEHTPGPVESSDVEDAEGGVRRVFRATGEPDSIVEGRLTLTVIRAEMGRIVVQRQAEDPHLHLIDGLDLYSGVDAAQLPLPDSLHPDTVTHRLIGERFASRVRPLLQHHAGRGLLTR